MTYYSFPTSLSTGQASAADLTAQPVSLQASYDRMHMGDQAGSPLRVAVPEPGAIPNFDDVFSLAVTSALFDQAILVICMTEPILTNWRRRLRERVKPIDGLELLDGRYAWSANWRAFFCQRVCDVTVLHGIHSALHEQSLPLSYARRLVDAVPAGLIVLA